MQKTLTRVSSSRNRLRWSFVLILAASGSMIPLASQAPRASAPGAPVITSFVLTELSPGSWRLSGTVTSSEGLEGMVLYFGGLVDETDAPNSNGTFSVDVAAEPISGDWATVYATDRWGLDSETETRYFGV